MADNRDQQGNSPEPQDDAQQKAAEIDAKYEPGARPTVVLPGTDGMVAGTAFADMVDENGEMKKNATSE